MMIEPPGRSVGGRREQIVDAHRSSLFLSERGCSTKPCTQQMSWLKKGTEEPSKRKRNWQTEEEYDENEDDEPEELVCVECAAAPQLMCNSCSGYHCTNCFSSTHAEDGAKAECEARYRVLVSRPLRLLAGHESINSGCLVLAVLG